MGTLAATPPACSAWDVPGVPARVGRGSHSRSGRRRPTRSRLTLPAQPSRARPARSADAARSGLRYRVSYLGACGAPRRAFRRRTSRCPRPGFSPSHIGRKSFFVLQTRRIIRAIAPGVSRGYTCSCTHVKSVLASCSIHISSTCMVSASQAKATELTDTHSTLNTVPGLPAVAACSHHSRADQPPRPWELGRGRGARGPG